MNIQRPLFFIFLLSIFIGCSKKTKEEPLEMTTDNPFNVSLNEPIAYADITPADIDDYVTVTIDRSLKTLKSIKETNTLSFENTFGKLDGIMNAMATANNNSFLLYWVSPDSLIRATGLRNYQKLDSLNTVIKSDKELFDKLKTFANSEKGKALSGMEKRLRDKVIEDFKYSGVDLNPEDLKTFKKLSAEITDLTSQFSTNLNTYQDSLHLSESESAGLPDNFKDKYRSEKGGYDIPIINATNGPMMSNAKSEAVRKAYKIKFENRADSNLPVIDSLISKRYQLGKLMGYDSYAAYALTQKMAKTPSRVWEFLNGLVDASKKKALEDVVALKAMRNSELHTPNDNSPVNPWDISYYHNVILKTKYNVDSEKVREYLPMDSCLTGMLKVYQKLLGFTFKKVNNPSVWADGVPEFEVYEGDTLKGRFYLDLYPRPNKETWFYAVELNQGRQTKDGFQIPEAMLLGNFTKATDKLPSLLSYGELRTLFHEFGHIMNRMSNDSKYYLLSDTKNDFVEAMSQIFENWIHDYDIVSSFAKNYKTGEVLPKELFENMQRAKNVGSGLSVQRQVRNALYDMTIYDKYDPKHPINTDQLWKDLDAKLGVMDYYIPGTHPQASWIHINSHPVYYYGYLWSDVYAQDMFTVFKEHGLLDTKTGVRYRNLILANGAQRDIDAAVEDFIGRPSNNKAYIKSLGLD